MSISYPLSMPSSPTAFRGMRLIGDSRVALDDSPFTGEQQVQDWGGKLWRFQAALPPMKRAEAEEWAAFLLKLNGPRYTFLAGDPLGAAARGALGGTPIVRYRYNRFTYSEQLNHANWLTGGTLVVTANAATAPDGTVTADRVDDQDAGGFATLYQSKAVSDDSTTWKISFYVKEGTATQTDPRLDFTGGGTPVSYYGNFIWATHTFSGLAPGATGTVENIGSGWYRISIAGANNSTGNTTLAGRLYPATAAAASQGYVDVWGAQLENSLYGGVYVQTTASEVTGETPLAGAQVLYIAGWSASVTGILKAGDYTQLGSGSTSRLYKVLQDVNSDGWGNLTLDVWPGLREVPADGASVVTSSCKGVFRLAQRLSPWDMDHQGIYGIAFEAVEAI